MQDMTLGNPVSIIIKFSIPLLIGNVFQQFYNVSDVIIVGRLIGVNALAAVGAASPIFFMLLLITLGFTAGLTVITAQRYGGKDEKGVRASVFHATVASLLFSLVVTSFLLLFLPQILHLMNVPLEIMEEAYKFISVLGSGLVMIVFYNLLSGFMRALGDSKTPLYFLIFSSLLNILLNLVLIYYGKMGVVGSALGTVIAITVSVICCLWYMARKFPILRLHREDMRFEKRLIKEHLRIAIPMSVQFSVIAFGLMIIQAVCNTFGPETIAAFTSALRIEQVATQPMVTLGIAMATYTAQNFGAGMIGRIRHGVFWSSWMSLAASVILALVVRFAGENMIQFFMEKGNERIVEIAQTYLNISTLFYFFLGQIFIYRNTLQGMGNAGIPLAASFVELAMRAFAAVYLAAKFGFVGLCYASPIAWVGGAAVVAAGYVWTVRHLSKEHMRNQLKKLQHRLGFHKKHPLPETIPAE